MRTLLFGGPSLYGMDLSPWPQLECHGPIRHGDLFRAGLRAGDAVLIVDGLYQHYPPIRFKELLALLRIGVRIYGAASMGALRAAELGTLGMVGVGRVYDWYASGELESDGDVALAHAEAEDGYRPLTLPIVSLLHAARSVGVLSVERVDTLIAYARTIPFSLRSAQALVISSRPNPDLHRDVSAVCTYLAESPEHDVKRRDVRALLATVSADADADVAALADAGVRNLQVSAWERQWELEETLLAPGGCTRAELLRFCQLFLPDWKDRHRRWVLDRIRATDPDRSLTGATAARGIWPEVGPQRTELVRRFEVDGLPVGDQLPVVLARTFRAGPGKFVYDDFPWSVVPAQEVEELMVLAVRALRANEIAEQRHAGFSHAQLAPKELVAVFAALWSEPWTRWSAIDRGFTSEEDFLNGARPFYVTARALVARQQGLVGT